MLESLTQTPGSQHRLGRRHRLDQDQAPYAQALSALASRDPIKLMVPGHGGTEAGNSGLLADFIGDRAVRLDVPMLLEGIDLEDDSPFADSLALAADAWGARRTWFLTNGASQANRTVALAVAGLGDHVIAQRSAHSSFSDGIVLAGLHPSYVSPSVDSANGIAHGVSVASLESALRLADNEGRPASAVYIVSPSYFGSVADVRGLADVAHSHGAPLIVDGAWGPHFGFHPSLPESPTRLGADLVISSTHKLAGSLTQSAMLHLGEGPFAEVLDPLICRAMTMTASTSSSALLMGSLDVARRTLATGEDGIGQSIDTALHLRELVRTDDRFADVSTGFGNFPDIADTDLLRVPIDVSATGISAHWIRDRLMSGHDVFFEMSTDTTLVAVIGAGKTPDVDAVFAALGEVVDSPAGRAEAASGGVRTDFPELPAPGRMRVRPRDGYFASTEIVSVAEAVGRISADSLAAYPPGVPNVMPGEEITAEVVDFLTAVAASPSGFVRGAVTSAVDCYRVLAD
ncbi:amino acid decarboxylase [Brevibacterium sp. 'Marine']|uniref:aminotransferase class I/II-fold pyridoxal phosphate-dependent enzyme n=1 Tax=Brevibacterium sp. 'Marine' TaxID=2725563 RepID=UPI002006EF0C|nr:amino acid decarboxylase [Brevibacterium sp. 'Marine']